MGRFLLASCLLCFAISSPAAASNYPCGPSCMPLLSRLIPQGAFGADFRPACRCHDACYSGNGSRKACDLQFRNDMYRACENSSNPAACRRRANHRYRVVRLFGGLFR